MSTSRSTLVMPSVLQWNVNDLKLAFLTFELGFIWSQLIIWHYRKLVSLLKRVTWQDTWLTIAGHNELMGIHDHLSTYGRPFITLQLTLTCKAAEYATVTLRVHEVDVTVVSIYMCRGVPWDPRKLLQVRQRCDEFVFLCSDFNSHHESCVQTLMGGPL